MGSSRNKEDLKGISTSVRFTDDQYFKVKSKAEANNVKVSQYIGYLVDKEEVSVTPQVLTKVQNIVNKAVEIAHEKSNNEGDAMQKEADELWQLLS